MKGREDTSTRTPATPPNGDVGFEVVLYLDRAHVFSALDRGDGAKQLDAIFEKAMRADDLLEARAALEQAAKEMGGVFTNVSKSAGVVAHDATGIDDLSPEERRNMLADRLRQAAERIPVALRMSN